MDLLALLRKEALTVRRNLGLFVVLLVVVPAALAAGASVYEQTIPQDIPVGVVPADDATTAEERRLVRGAVGFFSTPRSYDDRAAAIRAIRREQIYVAFVVPPGLMDANATVTVTVLTDRANAPLGDPLELALGVLETRFDRLAPADVSFEIASFGTDRSLAAYMLPSVLFAMVVLYGLLYVPYQVREERRVFDRLRTETRLELVLASKLTVYGLLVAVPAATITLAAEYFGYGFGALALTTLATLGLTFLYLAAAGLAVLFAFRLRTTAIFVNLGLAVGVLALSGLVYPVGFYSAARKTIARALPTHYSLVVLRGTMLRETSLSLYGSYLRWLGATTLLALALLAVGIRWFERGGVSE